MYRESEESIAAIARRLGLGPETFRRWVREDEVERGQRDGTTRAVLKPYRGHSYHQL